MSYKYRMEDNEMRVLKFGGTSLENAKKILLVKNIILTKLQNNKLAIVLSAPANITNNLSKLIDMAIINKPLQDKFIMMQNFLLNIAKDLKKNINTLKVKNILDKINKVFSQLEYLFHYISISGHCSNKIHAKILSQGEQFSIIIMEALLITTCNKVYVLSPKKFLLAESSNYLESTVDLTISIQNIKKIDFTHFNIILMAGFSAINKKNEIVLLGRNGSDYSAAVLSACLHAKYCEIWTDVNGIYTADPNMVSNAILLKHLSYLETITLSYLGAKVLHYKTILPLLINNIPCVVKNIMFPQKQGTIINHHSTDNIPKGITKIENIVMINIIINKQSDINILIKNIHSVLISSNITIFFITQTYNPNIINLCLLHKDYIVLQEQLYFTLKTEIKTNTIRINVKTKLSIISIIGLNINKNIDILNNFLSVFKITKKNILMISHNHVQHVISVVINSMDDKYILNMAHQILFKKEKILNVFIIGTGNIGKTLLKQIHHIQQKKNNNLINVRICGILNTKHTFINYKGIDLNNWEEYIQYEPKYTIQNFLSRMQNNILANPVIIDCTSSRSIVEHYINFFHCGLHVVTTNKIANTDTLEFYKKIRNTAYIQKKNFFYETNVGAGLPIIKTLQDLLHTGDKIIKFYGILSGSLSFIFGKLEENMPLSQAVSLAQNMGFTEPNPYIDLSGIDVARKLLILARELGLNLELQDIHTEPVINFDKIQSNITKLSLLKNLSEIDYIFSNKVKEAKKQNKVLRYIGSIDAKGLCSVKTMAIDITHPLYNIKNGENAFIFYTNYYQPLPLVLKGYGAGNNVTAAGILTDLLRINIL
ncbi:bifunctional aspartate kinase/homoserine dehydrogenase I [Enterobacteriaceae endosymbiont of Macroplea mutica]|uniref:bifunctional aspartate kinase/homoserine dehydrogenase I n=1 Tax=Enterobacteriaceae endosymbiont of Macroplea mutica TaxID=2675791 RepID=UPI001456E59F|nr:bifunctional aspartate kinase/homoserine dehydrogenase I [Enterobacteriaceae endosymbiont of Macroplea mutica]